MADTAVKSAHCVKVCRSLWSLQQSGQLCDIHLVVGEDVIMAHRTVLAASSPFFLSGEAEKSNGNGAPTRINISDVPTSLVQEVVQFAYTGVLSINNENVNEIYNICEKWHIESGKSFCIHFKKSQSEEKVKRTVQTSQRQLRKRPLNAETRKRIKCQLQNEDSEEELHSDGDDLLTGIHIKEENGLDELKGEPPSKRTKTDISDVCGALKGKAKRGRPKNATNKRRVGCPKKIKTEKVDEIETAERNYNSSRQLRRCYKCHQDFDTQQDLTTHKAVCRQSGSVRAYTIRKCRKCKQVFDTAEECSHHREKCEGDSCTKTEQSNTERTSPRYGMKRVYRKCHRCHKVFNTPNDLLEHKEACRQTKISNPYAIRKCRKCKQTFTTPEECTTHQLACSVPAEKPKPEQYKYKCDQCSKAFTKKRTLDSHMITKHWTGETPGPEYYFCKIEGCKFKTLYPYYMQKHIHWTHAKDKSIMCDICGAMSKNEYYLKAHKRIRHSDSEVYKCDICGMKIRTQQALKMHRIRVHGMERPTKLCSHCTYITYTKSELDRHMFQKHDIPLPSGKMMLTCPFCEYKAIAKSVMDEHVLRHTADERRFPCGQCNKRFITEKDLKSHLQVHNPERKRYKCPHCDYSTPYGRYKLRTHVETMHENKDYKPWACDICNYRTNIKGNLTLHLKNTHKLRVETKTRVIHKLDPISTGESNKTSADAGNKGKSRQRAVRSSTEQLTEQLMVPHLTAVHQDPLIVPQLPPAKPLPGLALQPEQFPEQLQRQQQPQQQLTYNTPDSPLISLAPERVGYKTLNAMEKETKMFVCELQSEPEPLQPVSESLALEGAMSSSGMSSSGMDHMSMHNMVTVSSHVGSGHHAESAATLGFNLHSNRLLGPTDGSGSQTMYMDTIINSLVSRTDQQL